MLSCVTFSISIFFIANLSQISEFSKLFSLVLLLFNRIKPPLPSYNACCRISLAFATRSAAGGCTSFRG